MRALNTLEVVLLPLVVIFMLVVSTPSFAGGTGEDGGGICIPPFCDGDNDGGGVCIPPFCDGDDDDDPPPQPSGTVCLLSEVPAGNVVYQVDNDDRDDCESTIYNVLYFHQSPDPSGQWVCVNYTTTPDGYVVIEELGSYDSGAYDCDTSTGSWGPREKIKIAASNDWVCDLGSVPNGFVITEKSYSSIEASNCDGVAYRIKDPDASVETICNISPIPDTYVTTKNTGTSSSCDTSSTNGSGPVLEISKMPISSGQWVCELNSPDIPNGWGDYVKYDSGSSSNCEGNAYTIELASAVNRSCDPWSLSDNLVVTQQLADGCYEFYDANTLTAGQSLWFCRLDRSFPVGFVVDQSNYNSTTCGTNSAYYHLIKPVTTSTYPHCKIAPVPTGFGVQGTLDDYNLCLSGAYQIGPILPNSWMCVIPGQGFVVPAGMVIYEIQNGGSCPSGDVIYRVDYPNSNGETNICTTEGIPSNYVITRHVSSDSSNCNNEPGLTIQLAPSAGSITVCSSSMIPSGFKIISSGVDSANCNGAPNDAYYVLSQIIASVDTVCGIPPDNVPAGYVVTARMELSDCAVAFGSGLNAMTVAIPSLTAEVAICYLSPVPSGFVKTANITRNECNTLVTNSDQIIRYYENITGTIMVCDEADVPVGWEIIGYASSGECRIIIAPSSGGVSPSEFIGSENEALAPINYECNSDAEEAAFLLSTDRNSMACP